MKCSRTKCIVNRLVGHREVRPDGAFSSRPGGVVYEQSEVLGRRCPVHHGLVNRLSQKLTAVTEEFQQHGYRFPAKETTHYH